LYRIGELSQLSQVSKRTIDYYTNLGLLTAQRSDSNYRYYDQSTLDKLRIIEKYKQMHIPLGEIKELMKEKQTVMQNEAPAIDKVGELTKHIHQLEDELEQVHSLLKDLSEEQRQELRNQTSGHTSVLMRTLLLFLL